MISILIAARNEEDNIIPCLEAISRLEYPADQYEVLIANDQSEDRTASLIASFIADRPHFRLFNITHCVGQLRGKSNALAQLARHARGEYLFFTDADIRVPPGWIGEMLAAFEPGTGVVTGTTTISGHRLFDAMQALEWLHALGLIRYMADYNIPLTAMGNNMAVRTAAYHATGGYESFSFSLVEDKQLFDAILARGYGFRQLLQPGVLALSQPALSLRQWLRQRRRWMLGALQLPWYWVVALYGQALTLPLLIVLAFFFPTLAFATFVAKAVWQSWFLYGVLQRAGQRMRFTCVALYPLYEGITSFLLVVFTLLPRPVEWKGRTYRTPREQPPQ